MRERKREREIKGRSVTGTDRRKRLRENPCKYKPPRPVFQMHFIARKEVVGQLVSQSKI
jgi:hypothetical protein